MPLTDQPFVPKHKHKAGGYGEVWLGTQTSLEHREVALKVIKVHQMDKVSARTQALALAKLPGHNNIVVVHELCGVQYEEYGPERDTIVMEWLPGQTLLQRLRNGITHQELITFGDVMLNGLRHMHVNDVPHGDFHGGNVIIGNDGRIKIIDVTAASAHTVGFSTKPREDLMYSDIARLGTELRDCISKTRGNFQPLKEHYDNISHVSTLDDLQAIFELYRNHDPGTNSTTSVTVAAPRSMGTAAPAEPEEPEAIPEAVAEQGLNEIDAAVLEAAGKSLMVSGHRSEQIRCDYLTKVATEKDCHVDDVLDSIEVLTNNNLFANGSGRFAQTVQLSHLGFDVYLRAYYPEYQDTFNAIVIAVARDGMFVDKEIAMAIKQPVPVVQHFLLSFKYDLDCYVNDDQWVRVTQVSAKLRRELKKLGYTSSH